MLALAAAVPESAVDELVLYGINDDACAKLTAQARGVAQERWYPVPAWQVANRNTLGLSRGQLRPDSLDDYDRIYRSYTDISGRYTSTWLQMALSHESGRQPAEWVSTLRAYQRLLLASLCSTLCSLGEHGTVSFDLVNCMGLAFQALASSARYPCPGRVDGLPLPRCPEVLSPNSWGQLLWFCETDPPRARAIDISQGRQNLFTAGRYIRDKSLTLPEVEFAWHCGRYQGCRWSIEPEPEPEGEPERATQS